MPKAAFPLAIIRLSNSSAWWLSAQLGSGLVGTINDYLWAAALCLPFVKSATRHEPRAIRHIVFRDNKESTPVRTPYGDAAKAKSETWQQLNSHNLLQNVLCKCNVAQLIELSRCQRSSQIGSLCPIRIRIRISMPMPIPIPGPRAPKGAGLATLWPSAAWH